VRDDELYLYGARMFDTKSNVCAASSTCPAFTQERNSLTNALLDRTLCTSEP